MLRGWLGMALAVGVALVLFAGAVLYSVHHIVKPRGFSGLEFAMLTAAANARTPMLAKGGALVADVMDDSPAARAKIRPGEVVAAIDGRPVASARAAAERIRSGKAGERITLTLYDVTEGEVKPRDVSLVFDAAPPVGKKFSVHPPRTLAKEEFYPPVAAANAAWSRRIFRGATIRPLALAGLGSGQCNAFAPEEWKVAGHAPDNSMFHVMAAEGFQHAIFQSAMLKGQAAESYVRAYLEKTFNAPVTLTPPQARPYGFVLRDFGNRKGGAGFVLYRVTAGRIALWLAAVAGGEAGWAKPLAGAVALSIRCAAPGAPALQPRDRSLLAARISMRCIKGQCDETDFAATYLTRLRLGYVHNLKGDVFLVKPSRDYWQNGAEGPGFYHQIGGENERLYPGRIN
jgi:hypothetical protein